jgi:predicted DNA-binding protein
MASRSKTVLIQSLVPATCRQRLDALARVRGCSRAAYLRRLVEMHVRAVTPTILRALDESAPRPRPRS